MNATLTLLRRPDEVPVTSSDVGCSPHGDRRRRGRLVGETLGWLLPVTVPLGRHLPDDEEGWEVRVYNVSRHGLAFGSTEPMVAGVRQRVRIGRGPMTRARVVRVVHCRRSEDGTFVVGAEFADLGARDVTGPRGLARAG